MVAFVKRKWKDPEQTGLFSVLPGEWEYYGVVTNFDLFKTSLKKVLEFYQKRGNAENFIREEKYGYDLKQFPCQKLGANHAFLQAFTLGSAFIDHPVALTEIEDKIWRVRFMNYELGLVDEETGIFKPNEQLTLSWIHESSR